MLWSEPDDRPPDELRAAQAKLRRLGRLLALAAVLAMLAVW